MVQQKEETIQIYRGWDEFYHQEIGGKLDIHTPDEGGTVVTCEFPFKKH